VSQRNATTATRLQRHLWSNFEPQPKSWLQNTVGDVVIFAKGVQWTFSSASAPYPPDQVHYAVHGTAWWPLHCQRLFVCTTADIKGKNGVLDQITARHHHHTAPTDSFLYTRASVSMAGAKDHVPDTHFQKGAQWTFSPGLAPTPPDQVHCAAHGAA
jgi:hypothetical protein